MKAATLRQALAAAAILALTPGAALAQEDVKERAEDIAEQANDVQQQAGELANDISNAQDQTAADDERNARAEAGADADDDDGFDWGLLGLLGLAGLLGLTRRDTRRNPADTRL